MGPVQRPGLCDFLETLDGRLLARNVDGLMDMIQFESTAVRHAGDGAFEGDFPDGMPRLAVQPSRFPPPVTPARGVRVPGEPMGDPAETSRSSSKGQSPTVRGNTEEIERGITLVVLPPDPELYWTGEIALLLGPPLDCFPTFDPDSGERIVFNLRENGGQWQIEAIRRDCVQ